MEWGFGSGSILEVLHKIQYIFFFFLSLFNMNNSYQDINKKKKKKKLAFFVFFFWRHWGRVFDHLLKVIQDSCNHDH
jgi:hypothetical protein